MEKGFLRSVIVTGQMSAPSYTNVVKGKLVLKGGITKKKKSSKSSSSSSSSASSSSSTSKDKELTDEEFLAKHGKEFADFMKLKEAEEESLKNAQKPEEKMKASLDNRTKAEKEFEAVQLRREEVQIKKKIEKSYRNRIEEFNKYLANLSEHNDIPRVGPG